eukprot:5300893-Alexandrium_andersonii.AAC.1
MGPARLEDALTGEGREARRVMLSNCRHARATSNSELRAPECCSPFPFRTRHTLARNRTHLRRMTPDT